jgi:acetate kinase
MNKNSGMLGLTETSNDMREIEQEAARGSDRHRLAIEIYCHHIKQYIGSYMAELGRADAIVFTGGVGENSRLVRRMITDGLTEFGIVLDAQKNEKNERDISAGKVKILVIPTNEELAIARDTAVILQSTTRGEAVRPVAAEEKARAVFRPEEIAKLVLRWAQNPKADAAVLAAKLSRDLGRTIDAETVAKELRRLSLAPALNTTQKTN